jgi:hypothetical protein
VTVHYFDDDIFLRHRTLTIRHLPGAHSNETIANCFIDVLTEFDIASKLRCMTLDNAKNCIHVGEIVNSKLRIQTVQFGCGCHIINLIVKKVLKLTAVNLEQVLDDDVDDWSVEMENSQQLISRFQFLIKKLRNIASTFHRSNQLNEALAKAQKEIAHLEKKFRSDDVNGPF